MFRAFPPKQGRSRNRCEGCSTAETGSTHTSQKVETKTPKGILIVAAKDAFDPKVFLAKVGEGKAVLNSLKISTYSSKATSPTRFYIQQCRP
jgi:hypothetical protein